jgi:hypothetical protein
MDLKPSAKLHAGFGWQVAALAVVAGLASALLMLSIASGASLSFVLFLFSPLPILLVGIGWDHRAAALAAAVGTLVIGVILGLPGVRSYAVSVALPGWWLSFLVMQRPVGGDRSATADRGCTPGTLVLWCAGLGVVLVMLTIPSFGFSPAAYRAGIAHAVEELLRRQTDTPAGTPLILPSGANADDMAALFAMVAPPIGAVSWMVVALANVWLAARIAQAAGHLARPWPVLSGLRLPRLTLAVLAAAVALAFAPGLAGLLGQVAAATLFVAFVLLGLAVVHAGTRGFRGRILVLIAVYLMLAIQPWAALCLAVLGALDQFFSLRHRAVRPPAPPRASS